MKRSELLGRVSFVNHESKKILKFDFSDLSIQDAREAISSGARFIAQVPHRSVLTLTDVSSANYDKDLTEALN